MKMMKAWHITMVVFFSLNLWKVLPAQEIGARATLDSTDILIGDQLKLHLELTVPAGSKVSWPFFEDTLTAHVEVLRRSAIDTATSGKEKYTLRQELVITSFDSGSYVVPPIPFRFHMPGDSTGYYAETDPLRLSVSTVQTDPAADIKPIKPPLKAPITFREIAPWLLGALLLALLAFSLYYFIKRRKEKKPIFQIRPKPALPPHEIALEAFEALRRKKLWQSGKVKDYYSEMTDIVREYIEGRFRIRALEMTTDEITEALKSADVSGPARERLKTTLVSADLVKFAKAQPLPAENDTCLDICVEFVRETRQVNELRSAGPQAAEPSNKEGEN